ncbi:MAG TPA: amidohydrolase family protein [Bryobacteraceae bacterium]|nr:amidohydrolase family protein [Bryobacteraceae bacterium]
MERNLVQWFFVAIFSIAGSMPASAQSHALPSGDVQAIYERLLEKIKTIKIFDHHAHPGYGDDSDVDAQATPPEHLPLRERSTNPELVAAVKALFDYPYSDMSEGHMRWLQERSSAAEKAGGTAYWDRILDQCGIESTVANRVAMASYLNPKRFRWVFFMDSVLFPFDNKTVIAENPDEGVYIPLQEKVLHRYLQQAGLSRLPASFDAYLAFVSRILEENQKKGGIAEKFEAAYFRSLYFADPPRQAAAAVYQKYRSGGVPTPEDYKTFQDYVFRYLVTEGGRLHLPVHIHTAVGEGDYFSLRKGDVLNLENIVKDPRYLNTTFVLIHGGYPYFREVIWLAAMKNVYLDSSEFETLEYPSEMKNVLKLWLETYPDKITFGSDAYPYSAALGSEETYWLGVYSARDALAAALAEMVASNEVTEDKALEIAHGYLHDNAVRLYPPAP